MFLDGSRAAKNRTFWAWVGELGDDVDAGLRRSSSWSDVDRPVGTAGPDYLRWSPAVCPAATSWPRWARR